MVKQLPLPTHRLWSTEISSLRAIGLSWLQVTGGLFRRRTVAAERHIGEEVGDDESVRRGAHRSVGCAAAALRSAAWRIESSEARVKRRPSVMTTRIFSTLRTSTSGSASRRTRSAYLPAAMLPTWSRMPSDFAAL